LEQLVSALRKTIDFVNEVNRGEQKIKFIDIGGGLPVKYNAEYQPPSMEEYIEQLQKQCPELFSNKYQLITEFGRYIHANAGFTASRVEYIKSYGDTKTAIIHVGADLLMRHCYMPQDWPHEISIADANGQLKSDSTKETYTIAGPLCFGGDIIEQKIFLPKLDEGDYIIIHDTGAYTLSMWNRHTSRLIPKVLGYDGTFAVLKERETLDELYNFWDK
jgi:diaminopimelate decarboxylase